MSGLDFPLRGTGTWRRSPSCARFLATTPPVERPAPLVRAMREMFGLSAIETCAAIRKAQEIRRLGNGAS